MRRSLWRVATAFPILMCLGFLLAGDFWNLKDVDQWSEEELIRVLTHSAWAKRTTLSYRGARPSVLWNARAETNSCPVKEEANAGRYAGRRAGAASIRVLVRWESALPVKLALARLGFLGRSPDPAEVNAFLRPDPNHYVVSVSGLPGGLVGEGLSDLAQLASLRRKRQDPIYADRVEVQSIEEMTELRFHFPRRPPLQLSDKEVEFVLNLPTARIKRGFDLRKMGFGDEAVAL